MAEQSWMDSLLDEMLEAWILSDDPMEGDLWDDLCANMGMDSESLAIRAQKARQKYPRLRCGHYDIPDNVYQSYNTLTKTILKRCRTCAGSRDKEEIVNG